MRTRDRGRTASSPARRRLSPGKTALIVGVPLVAVVGIVIALGAHTGSGTQSGNGGGNAAAAAQAPVPQVGDISCDTAKHGDAPITIHLSILVNGVASPVPATVGVVQPQTRPAVDGRGEEVVSARCYYWLHTGAADGVVHVAAPTSQHRPFVLGDFFDVWHQPLGTAAVGTDEGAVTSYVDGKRYSGNPRTIPLTDHAVIQLDVGRNVAPAAYDFAPYDS
jgi:hypothetical protein